MREHILVREQRSTCLLASVSNGTHSSKRTRSSKRTAMNLPVVVSDGHTHESAAHEGTNKMVNHSSKRTHSSARTAMYLLAGVSQGHTHESAANVSICKRTHSSQRTHYNDI